MDAATAEARDTGSPGVGRAAAAPPFLRAQRIGGRPAIDGGYTDSAPIPLQSDAERSATLVLPTRHYAHLPVLFRWRGRMYWQPSRPVPVSTWDCTIRATVQAAFDLGAQDARMVSERLR